MPTTIDVTTRVRSAAHSHTWKGKQGLAFSPAQKSRVLRLASGELAGFVDDVFQGNAELEALGGWGLHSGGFVGRDDWVGGNASDVRRLVKHGDLDIIKDAEKLAKGLERKLPATGQSHPQQVPSVAGGAPSVPAFLAGNPVCMQRTEYVASATAPIKVCVAINASGGFASEQLRQRALCIVGLVKLIGAMRPVELTAYQYSSSVGHTQAQRLRGSVVEYRLGCQPVDWAMAGALLGNSVLYRGLSFALISALDGTAGYDGTMCFGSGNRAELMGLARGTDLHFGPWQGTDNQEPIEWVETELQRFLDGNPRFDLND